MQKSATALQVRDVPVQLRQAVKSMAAAQGITMQGAVIAALQMWVNFKKEEAKP